MPTGDYKKSNYPVFWVNEKFVMGVFFVLLLLYEFFVLFVGITSHPAHVVSAGVI